MAQPPYRTLANSPLWPPNPSASQAASPGPDPQDVRQAPPQKSAPPPPQSKTKDTSAHHSSPTPGDKQTPYHKTLTPPKKPAISTLPDVPMHKTKHSEPVGRPKNRNYD